MAHVTTVDGAGMAGLMGRQGWGFVADPGHEEIKTYGEVGGLRPFGEEGDRKAVTGEGKTATGTLEGTVATGAVPAVPALPVAAGGGPDLGGLVGRLEGGERGPEIANDLKAFIEQFKGAPLQLELLMKVLDILTGKAEPTALSNLVNQIKNKVGKPGTVAHTDEPTWNGGNTYTVPTANGPVTVLAGTPIAGYTWGEDNHYHNLATGQTVYDPLKITLDGTDAKINTTDHVQIRMENGTVKTMSGGLNDNEAWLVKDRDGQGVSKNGVVDGEDVFGDHMGNYKNAYDQLAQEYAAEVKTDANGNKYIDLTDPNSVAAKELKLMDSSGNLYKAADKLNKLYVSYEDVNRISADGQTAIKQEGLVEFKDKHTAKAVDQWFTDISATAKAA